MNKIKQDLCMGVYKNYIRGISNTEVSPKLRAS